MSAGSNVLLLTPGFGSNEHQTESETNVKAGKILGECHNRICFQHKKVKPNMKHKHNLQMPLIATVFAMIKWQIVT